jgi:hypothetical protein
MSQITGILCQMITGSVSGAGTDGSVYLGLGGREFRLDSKEDDYERGSWREYVVGDGPWSGQVTPVNEPQWNDPRVGFPLDTVNLTKSPVYVRFEPSLTDDPDNWNLRWAAALVYAPDFVVGFTPPVAFDNLWLGLRSGQMVFLTDAHWRGEKPVRDIGRTIVEATEVAPGA